MPAATLIEPGLEYVVTVTLIVADIARSTAFYRDVLGGDPTDDKPQVFATPPKHAQELSAFLNLRVTDIKRFYQRCRARGALFITEPKVHPSELRCYMRDPDRA